MMAAAGRPEPGPPGGDDAGDAAAAGDDAAAQPCPHCGQSDFNYEDLDEGTKLVCRDCGFVLDEVLLVHQRGMDEGGQPAAAAYVAGRDDGRLAGAALLPGGAAPLSLRVTRDAVLRANRERLDRGLTFLQLPQHVATAARQLLPQVVDAYGAAQPRMLVSPAVVAAVVYGAARQERHALSLGAAAAALGAQGPLVFKEHRRIKEVLELEVAPPSLEATVVYAASLLLPHYLPAVAAGGALRRQPALQKALQLARLVSDVGAAEGRSPWVAGAAVMALSLAEHFRDAAPSIYGREVAERLGHSPDAVLQHIRAYEQHLAPLLELLPFAAAAGGGGVGVQVVRNAGILLKLQALSRKGAPAAAGGGGDGAAAD